MLKIQRGFQWYHQILCFIALLLSILKNDFEEKPDTLRLSTFEKNIKSKSLISQSFYSRLIIVRGVLELSGSQLSKAPLTFSQKCILRG